MNGSGVGGDVLNGTNLSRFLMTGLKISSHSGVDLSARYRPATP
jgi:hypothetical protein